VRDLTKRKKSYVKSPDKFYPFVMAIPNGPSAADR
jgi:hypothetical protein